MPVVASFTVFMSLSVCLKWSTCQSQRVGSHTFKIFQYTPLSSLILLISIQFFQFGLKPVLITGLPEYYDGCYKVEDVVQLLLPFGFQNKSDNIYIVPQIRMVKNDKKHQMHILERNENLKKCNGCIAVFMCALWVSGVCQDANDGVCAQPNYKSQGRGKDDYQMCQNLLSCVRFRESSKSGEHRLDFLSFFLNNTLTGLFIKKEKKNICHLSLSV